jgi:hypothetical protein
MNDLFIMKTRKVLKNCKFRLAGFESKKWVTRIRPTQKLVKV